MLDIHCIHTLHTYYTCTIYTILYRTGIFLHSVSDEVDRSTVDFTPKDRVLSGVPIFYFRTYVGAAVKAYQYNFMSSDALNRVIIQAKADLSEIEPYPTDSIGIEKSSRWSELEADIRLANTMIHR